ncbi:MAG: carboxymuconolactone decarboxylase family protein [Gammaproteobacteria bacterium]|nr:MAG: carboxymuconolactone decarboxylase family protein [Gammaproteobacteria bacterium]TDJ39969.1 MAG: carboxymuconolactone decarboxylase family protein [Gammaproteobacteria bacterium]
MTWLTGNDSAPSALEGLLGLRPELLSRYRAFYATFWEDGLVPPRTLELCRLRIAAIHECEAEWLIRDTAVGLADEELAQLRSGGFDGFSKDEQAALAVAEQIPHQHHQISDADIQVLENMLAPAGAVSLLTALAFFDVASRLKLVLGVPETPTELAHAPLDGGALP